MTLGEFILTVTNFNYLGLYDKNKNLIGTTSADVRDVIIFQDTNILSCNLFIVEDKGSSEIRANVYLDIEDDRGK